ncbi:MAG: glycosyltransferase family 1 protein, partial [Nitrospinaceae bacterium]|nr:glycosyltransferase family 4 protein [Nitrospinaceae bacterium]NIR55366.1 glycosyltransferase family 4 protein [Nitrospinaceae bacterium]NIS85806.1 glycosyltransferase family 4 protein [Nitrospinaceae bacterium]NIT80688.1 glycosyltransferase family 4 protein [Nitrospinaceae bacterium]NIU44860.1 glycosyltransferase family 4 protein [Nitrospinaceae bacterium]
LADIFWIAHPEWLPKKVSWPITLATRVSVQKADVVVTTTQFSKREIMKYLNVPEKKIEI